MASDGPHDDTELSAGDFSAWLTDMRAAIRDQGDSTVPCAGCTACCTSSQFVHIGPDERDTLAHIPADLLFAAPGLPDGNVLLGYDQRGHCPMLVDNRCSIYQHRPRACRTYDCRVFPVAGIEPRDSRASLVARRARRWRFSFPNEADTTRHEATRAAAAFLIDHRHLLPVSGRPTTETQLAVLAIAIHDLFLGPATPRGETQVVVAASPEAVRQRVVHLAGASEPR